MFRFLKSKSPIDKLNKKYRDLLAAAHKQSHINRSKSDELMAEAEEVLKEIERLKAEV